ncbi:MAG: FG-GAP-like repeat-containing protein [Acidobacteriota bacterium]|nr:FG-GAP-like repeat-containing protein [Acidobacteriota bacterium]
MNRPALEALAFTLLLALSPVPASAQDGAADIRKQAAEAHFQHGLRMVGLRNNDRAIELFQYAIALDPDHAGAHFYVGLAYIQRGYTSLRRADHHLSRAIAVDGTNPRQYHWRGIARLRLGDYPAATADFEVVLRETPDSATTLRALGAALLRMGAPGPAAAALRQAADLEPELLETRWNLMVAAGRAGDDPDALPERYRLDIPDRGAASPFRFEEVSAEIGIERWSRARGSGWADFDGDGDVDLVSLGIRDPHALYRNRLVEDGAATFAAASLDAALFDPRGGWSALFFDYDRDGDPDLYVTRDGWDGEDTNSLYRNDGGRFVDVAAAAGVASAADGLTAAVADVNRDGLLDLYVANGVATRGGAPNELFLGAPDGRFVERGEAMGVADHGRSVGSAFGDYDGDGWPDLLVVNFFDGPVLYRNLEGAGFEDVSAGAGIAAPHEGFVGFFFDYDNDGWLDVFVVGFASDMEVALQSRMEGRAVHEGSRLALYRNDRDGSFTDVTTEAGLSWNLGAMAATFGDYDNDGWQDIFIGVGAPPMERFEANRLFRNLGDGTFADVSASAGVDDLGKGHGATFADPDHDGDLDLFVPIGGAFPGDRQRSRFYRNPASQLPHPNGWLHILLRASSLHPDAVGARVALRVTDAPQAPVQLQEVAVGGGFGVTPSPILEFGLGQHQTVAEVTIRWPGGGHRVLRNVPANQRILVIEDEPGYQVLH